MLKKPCKPSRKGLTLVEVIAATALLSSTLVGVLAAFSTINRQNQKAVLRLEAMEFADKLLFDWMSDAHGIPAEESGPIASRKDWRWQTSVSKPHPLSGVRTITLRIIKTDSRNGSAEIYRIELPYFDSGNLRAANWTTDGNTCSVSLLARTNDRSLCVQAQHPTRPESET